VKGEPAEIRTRKNPGERRGAKKGMKSSRLAFQSTRVQLEKEGKHGLGGDSFLKELEREQSFRREINERRTWEPPPKKEKFTMRSVTPGVRGGAPFGREKATGSRKTVPGINRKEKKQIWNSGDKQGGKGIAHQEFGGRLRGKGACGSIVNPSRH